MAETDTALAPLFPPQPRGMVLNCPALGTPPFPILVNPIVAMTQGTCFLEDIGSRESFTSKCVDLLGHNFHMGRTDTVPYPTEVVNRQSLRDITPKGGVCETMSQEVGLANSELPIAVAGYSTAPQPAIATRVDLADESFKSPGACFANHLATLGFWGEDTHHSIAEVGH